MFPIRSAVENGNTRLVQRSAELYIRVTVHRNRFLFK